MNISKKIKVKKDIPFSQSSSSPRSLSFPRKRESIKRGLIPDPATKGLKQATMKQLFTYGTKGEKTKQTEIGEIPISWTYKHLSELCHYSSGRTPARSNLSYWSNGEIPWVSISDMQQGKAIFRTKEKISKQAFIESFGGKKLVPKHTLLMSFKLTIGRTCFAGVDLVHNEAIVAIYPKKEVLDKLYLSFYLPTVDYSIYQDRQIKGNTLNKSKIDKIKIPLPPLEEQKKIAGVLSQVQKAIETQNQQIKATKELKQATMKQLFTYGTRGEKTQTKKDIPFLQSSSSSHSLSLPRKQESIKRGSISDNLLRMINLGDICTFEYGKPLKKADRYKGKYPVLGSNGIVDYHNQYLVKGPCIIVGRKGTAGKITYSENNCFPIDTTFFVQLRNKNQCDLKYLDFAMQVSNLEKLKTQSNVPGLNRNDAYKIKIPLPSLEEQKEIADILQGIDKKVEVHEKKKKALEELFKTMLNKLMTGKIRVHNLNILKQYKGYYV